VFLCNLQDDAFYLAKQCFKITGTIKSLAPTVLLQRHLFTRITFVKEYHDNNTVGAFKVCESLGLHVCFLRRGIKFDNLILAFKAMLYIKGFTSQDAVLMNSGLFAFTLGGFLW